MTDKYPTRETQMTQTAARLQYLDEYDLRDAFELAWVAEFNKCQDMTYCEKSGKLPYVDVIQETHRNGAVDCTREGNWRVNWHNSPTAEAEAVQSHIVERFGSVGMFKVWNRLGKESRNLTIDRQELNSKWQICPTKVFELLEWLLEGELSPNLARVNKLKDALNLPYNATKYKVTIDEFGQSPITVQQWKNGKLRITGLSAEAIDRFKQLQAANETSWRDCKKRTVREW